MRITKTKRCFFISLRFIIASLDKIVEQKKNSFGWKLLLLSSHFAQKRWKWTKTKISFWKLLNGVWVSVYNSPLNVYLICSDVQESRLLLTFRPRGLIPDRRSVRGEIEWVVRSLAGNCWHRYEYVRAERPRCEWMGTNYSVVRHHHHHHHRRRRHTQTHKKCDKFKTHYRKVDQPNRNVVAEENARACDWLTRGLTSGDTHNIPVRVRGACIN